MHVILFPGRGHDRHNHPQSGEILYILSGRGDQMINDGEPKPVEPGDAVWIPKGVFFKNVAAGDNPGVARTKTSEKPPAPARRNR